MFKWILSILILLMIVDVAAAVSLNQNGGSVSLNGAINYDFVNLTNGAILYINAYNGTATTGTLTLNVTYNVNVDATSSIIGDSRGYRSGAGGVTGDLTAKGGEVASSGGGSNGATDTQEGMYTYGSGAGAGAYAATGGTGGCAVCDQYNIGGGLGGFAQGTSNGWDIQMGNGAGGGGRGDGNVHTDGSSGSSGGAVLRINAGGNINIHGTVNFNGGAGGNGGDGWYPGGGGAGASGGGILLNGTNINVSSATITANGGSGGNPGTPTGGSYHYSNSGGSGSGGRYKVFYRASYITTGATISAGSTYSEDTNTAPTVPSLTTHSSYHTATTTTVNWTASTDVNGNPITYHYNIGTTSGGTQIANDSTTTGLGSSGFLEVIPNTYYWKVKACDSWECSSWTSESSFSWNNSAPSVPTGISPGNNQLSYADTTVNFTWNASTDPDGDSIANYTWQIANNSAFTDIWQQDVTTNTYTSSRTVGVNTQLFFRVRANDSYYPNSPSSSWSSTINQRDVQLTSPANGSLIEFTYPPSTTSVNFTWNATNTNAPYFQYVLSSDIDFNSIVSDTTSANTYRTYDMSAGAHYWRVRTYYGGTTYGVWSPTFNLTANATYGGDGTTGIQGTIYDPYGGTTSPVSGAKVFIYNNTWSNTMFTGSNGYYIFKPLADNSVYYITASASNYITSDIQTINTTAGIWRTHNIPIIRCTSGLECQYDKTYITFFVYNIYGGLYSSPVTVRVYKDAVLYDTKISTTYDSSVTFFLDKTQIYNVTFTGAGGDSTYKTVYPQASLGTPCYSNGICYSVVLGSYTPYMNGVQYNISHTSSTIWFNVSDPNSEITNLNVIIGNTSNNTLFQGNYNGNPINASYAPPNTTSLYTLTYNFSTVNNGFIIGTQYINLSSGYVAKISTLANLSEAHKVFIMIMILIVGILLGNERTGSITTIIGGVGAIGWNWAVGLSAMWNFWIIVLLIIAVAYKMREGESSYST